MSTTRERSAAAKRRYGSTNALVFDYRLGLPAPPTFHRWGGPYITGCGADLTDVVVWLHILHAEAIGRPCRRCWPEGS